MKSRKSFLLRLDPALYAALERWAEQDLRSVNGQIEFVLKQAVLARDRKALPPEASTGLAEGRATDGADGPK